MTVGLPKYDFLYDNNTFPMSSISGLRDINKYTILFSAYANFTIDALYDYTLYVRGAYNGPYIRIKHHIYVRAYNHRITNGQRIIPSYDETEFTAHLLLPNLRQ